MVVNLKSCTDAYEEYFERMAVIKKDWENFTSTGDEKLVTAVSPEVLESWKRSYKLGVNPRQIPVNKPGYKLSPAELSERLKAKVTWLEIASPLLELLVANLGPDFRIDYYDEDLYLLKQFFGKPEAENISKYTVLGVNRSEEYTGTNAMCMARHLKRPVQLSGPEHYIELVQTVTCSSVPLISAEGVFEGVLNIFGPFEKAQNHTLGMAITLSKAIAGTLVQYNMRKEKELALQYTENIINSISDGVIVLDSFGIITKVNRTAGKILKLPADDMIGKDAAKYFNSDSSLIVTLKTGQQIIDQELNFNKGMIQKIAIGSCFPIKHTNQITGVLAVFKEMKEAKKMVKNLAGFKAYYTFEDIKGDDDRFVQMLKLARHAAMMPAHVLLLGESGTGKELIAQSIHNASSNFEGPFVGINCAAIPSGLIESELFGYEGGAFTGGKREGQPGKLSLAEGGTLFLDEIDSLPISHQATLLRVLQNKSYVRVGGTRELEFNARLIIASNRNLWDAVSKGEFRQDLYYRINVVTINIPPLRERPADIINLAVYFADQCANRMGYKFHILDDVLARLVSCSWPGNVRELENMIERCAITAFSQGKDCIDMEILEMSSTNMMSKGHDKFVQVPTEETSNLSFIEKQSIESALAQTKYNIMQAAKLLGISRRTLYNKIEKYNINLSPSK